MGRNYPEVDINLLHKGYHFTEFALEKIVGFRKDKAKFVDERFYFRSFLERKLKSQGKDWMIEMVAGELWILTDMEASVYGERHARLAAEKLRRNNRKMKAVDRSQLTNQRKLEHDREERLQGLDIQALNMARRRRAQPVRPQPVVHRVTPPGVVRQQLPPQPPQPPLPMAWWQKGN